MRTFPLIGAYEHMSLGNWLPLLLTSGGLCLTVQMSISRVRGDLLGWKEAHEASDCLGLFFLPGMLVA